MSTIFSVGALSGIRRSLIHIMSICIHVVPTHHDDPIKWKHLPYYWPSVKGIHRSLVDSPHKGRWRRALVFVLSAPEQMVEQTIEKLVIGDAIALIMTLLQCVYSFLVIQNTIGGAYIFKIFIWIVSFIVTTLRNFQAFETASISISLLRITSAPCHRLCL